MTAPRARAGVALLVVVVLLAALVALGFGAAMLVRQSAAVAPVPERSTSDALRALDDGLAEAKAGMPSWVAAVPQAGALLIVDSALTTTGRRRAIYVGPQHGARAAALVVVRDRDRTRLAGRLVFQGEGTATSPLAATGYVEVDPARLDAIGADSLFRLLQLP